MVDVFTIKLLLSFLVGGLWVLFATIFADKFGTKIGGLVTGFPSTLLFGLLFIAWTQSAQVAVSSTTIVPAIGGIDVLFMAFYIYFARKSFWGSLFLSVVLWAVLSYFLVIIHFNNFIISLLLYFFLLVISYFVVEHKFMTKSVEGKKIYYTIPILLFRGILSGGIIAFAVFMAKIGGPIIGGIFTMFPAATISTILITHHAHGADFSSGIVKSTILGTIAVIIYVILVRYTYLSIGLLFGTIVAIIGSFFGAYAVYLTISKGTS